MNKKILSSLLLMVLLTAGYFSCKKADPEPVQSEDYFPLEKGKYVIYDVDSTIWDDALCVKITRHYQFMYTIADTFTDAEKTLNYRIDTRVRKKPEEPWKPHHVYYVRNTGTTLEMAHDELWFIKMQFPINEGDSWEGNALIDTDDPDVAYFKDWHYRYESVRKPFNAGNLIFDNTVSVIQTDETVNDPVTITDQFAMRNYGKEVFANGVGMVYREYIHWTYNPELSQNRDPLFDRPCLEGTGVVMRAVEHN